MQAAVPRPSLPDAGAPTRHEGSRDPGELRIGHIAHWGWDRLFGVINSLGYEIVVTIRPRAQVSPGAARKVKTRLPEIRQSGRLRLRLTLRREPELLPPASVRQGGIS